MTTLTLHSNFDSNMVSKNNSPGHPLWDNSSGASILTMTGTYTNWWSDLTPSPNRPDVFYSNDEQSELFRSYTQYGQNTSIFASAKMIKMVYRITNEVINADNSISCDLVIEIYGASRKTENASAGVSVVNALKLGTEQVFSRTGNTIDSYAIDLVSKTYNGITIPAQGSFNTAKLTYTSTYPNKEYPNSVINLGSVLFNPLYAEYVPMKTRKTNTWKNLNKNGGKIKRRVAGAWADFSVETIETENVANKGHNRRRTGGAFKQLPKLD